MNRGDVVGVKCPCCREVLYRQALLAHDIWGKTKDSPGIENDTEGDFMKCPHCRKRIALQRVGALPSGSGLSLHPVQKCDQELL